MSVIAPTIRLAVVREVQEGKIFSPGLPLDYPDGGGGTGQAPPGFAADHIGDHTVFDMAMTLMDSYRDDSVTMSSHYPTRRAHRRIGPYR